MPTGNSYVACLPDMASNTLDPQPYGMPQTSFNFTANRDDYGPVIYLISNLEGHNGTAYKSLIEYNAGDIGNGKDTVYVYKTFIDIATSQSTMQR
jgi:hypothetical protein